MHCRTDGTIGHMRDELICAGHGLHTVRSDIRKLAISKLGIAEIGSICEPSKLSCLGDSRTLSIVVQKHEVQKIEDMVSNASKGGGIMLWYLSERRLKVVEV
ncbi:MAG: hypothetical protein KGH59_03875 [Candidatus Micrarchaeota archaeon]|nr:hypothetical protein [Candidatus Micrarchaeota archaeon]MDE1846652.1 hypothetical protein [Candidatus Micrarchaeota archaeon]